MQSGSQRCPQSRVLPPLCSSMFSPVVAAPSLPPGPLGMWAVGITRSVGKAATTSSHLLTTSARFCYTKCAEVCSRMRLSIRHVAHQNVVFIFSQPRAPAPLPLSLICLSACPFVFLFFWLVVWLFGRLLLTEMHENGNNAKFMAHKT